MITLSMVLFQLRKHKGQFGLWNALTRTWSPRTGAIRHLTRRDRFGIPLCPLATLKGDKDGDNTADNNLASHWAAVLGIPPLVAREIQRCADYDHHPGRDKLLATLL